MRSELAFVCVDDMGSYGKLPIKIRWGNTMITRTPEQSQLEKKAPYENQYNPDKLFPIARALNRAKINVPEKLPFYGCDVWNHFEVSWLDLNGKPMVALAVMTFDCTAPFIIESKSMKLYFNSFNNTKIKDRATLRETIKKDLESRVQSPVQVEIIFLRELKQRVLLPVFDGVCIDDLPIVCDTYQLNSTFLETENESAEEVLCTDLLKSNCLVTNQPDWASVQIHYAGKKINHAGLLKYIVSFRDCNEFSETAVERIFMDIATHCKPVALTVHGRFTRRGGIDINVIRSTKLMAIVESDNLRLARQ